MAAPKIKLINYQGLHTLKRLHASDSLIKGVRGPVGSGKTVGCCWEIFRLACYQEPYENVRYTKFAMIRNTYQELLQTTLETWEQWFGDYCHIRRTAPIEARMRVQSPYDNTEVDLWLIFLALDIPSDVKKVKSLEVTASFINEASECGRWVLTKAFERRGRYPNLPNCGPSWAGVLMDTNSCDDDHWWYKASEEEKNQGWEFFDQPPALLKFPETKKKTARQRLDEFFIGNPGFPYQLKQKVVKDFQGNLYIANPKAENVENLPLGYDYWLDQVPGKPLDEITVFILNEYGTVTDSKPVYPEYIDSIHCAEKDIEPIENIGITLGFDYGRTPACTVSQINAKGQKRVLEEMLVEEHGSMGIRTFSRTVVVPFLLENYLQWLIDGIVKSYGDPAGNTREQTDEKTCFMILNECPVNQPKGGFPDYKKCRERLKNPSWVKQLIEKAKKGIVSLGDLGIKSRPARTNSFEARKDAVSNLLISFIDNEPSILISPKIRYLRKGLRGKYAYKRIQVSGAARYKDEPDKNIYSHISEAFQYDCLESSFLAVDPSAKAEEEEQEKRKEIGSAACAAWDELKEIQASIAEGRYEEYYEENYL